MYATFLTVLIAGEIIRTTVAVIATLIFFRFYTLLHSETRK